MNYIDTINIISHNSQLEIIQNSPLAPHLSWLLPLYCSVKTVHFFAMQMLDYVKSGWLSQIESQPQLRTLQNILLRFYIYFAESSLSTEHTCCTVLQQGVRER